MLGNVPVFSTVCWKWLTICSRVLCVSRNDRVLWTNANFEFDKILNSQKIVYKSHKSCAWQKECWVKRLLDKGHASRKKNYVKFNFLNILVYTVSCICKLFELLSTLWLLEKNVYYWLEHSIPLKELSTIIKYLNYQNPCSSVTSLRKFNNLTDSQQYSQKVWTKEFQKNFKLKITHEGSISSRK